MSVSQRVSTVVMTAGAAVLAVVVAVAATWALPKDDPEPDPVQSSTPAPTPPPSSSPAPPPPPGPNEGEPPAGEGSFSVRGADGGELVSGAQYASMPYELPLNPAGPQESMVRWVEGWGVSPDRAEEGTVYVLGHAWAQAPLVFNPLSERVSADALGKPDEPVESLLYPVFRRSSDVLDGARVEMVDGGGNRRVWEVDDAFLVDKEQAIDDKGLMDESVAGRVVLIACSVDGGEDLGFNVVVTGHLI